MKLKLATIALALLAIGHFLPAAADSASTQSHITISPMLEYPGSGRTPGPDDYSALLRRGNWIEVEIDTSGLDPETPYTLWAVAFNRPQYCATTPCSAADAPFTPGHDPRVQVSPMYVTGGYSGTDGTLRLEGRLFRAKNGVKPTQTLFGPGLLNTQRGELHFILRGHGPNPGDPALAFGSYNGGCSDDNPCGDHQMTIHLPR